MDVLGHVAMRVYGEALSSETTRAAQRLISQSVALRNAVARGDRSAARSAVQALIATDHMTRVRVRVGGRLLIDLGSPLALGNLTGSLGPGPGGAPATYELSVQNAPALVSATQGLVGSSVIVRSGRRLLATRLGRPPARLPQSGQVEYGGHRERVFSFPVRTFNGAAGRIWLLRPEDTLTPLCGAGDAQTRALTVGFVGEQIYNEEARGGAAQGQVRRAASSPPLLSAIARADPVAARSAVIALLNQHIVRLRVLRGSQLLADVGGPYVLAPVTGIVGTPAAPNARIVLSVQDDLGYLKLAHRLIGVEVLIRQGARQIMGTLQPGPPVVPDLGPVSWRGRRYEAFSLQAASFPSGTLRISLLVPLH